MKYLFGSRKLLIEIETFLYTKKTINNVDKLLKKKIKNNI